MTKLSHSCFIEIGVLWKRTTRHHGQHTVILVPKTLTEKLLSEVHGNVLYGDEGHTKPKKGLSNPTGGQVWMVKSINI